MTYKQSAKNRITSIVLTLAMLLSIIPFTVFSVSAASVDADLVADISTMDSWKDFFFASGNISTENAGAVWTDKSVFTDAAAFADLGITKNNQNSFLVALSAMAANMSITGTSGVPTDTMLILDVSGSMNDNYGNNDVAEDLVNAANESIATLLSANKTSRVGVVLYSGSSPCVGIKAITFAERSRRKISISQKTCCSLPIRAWIPFRWNPWLRKSRICRSRTSICRRLKRNTKTFATSI